MAIQTQTYKKRLREHSGLSPQALLVAIVIADLRYEARKRHNEPLPLTGAQLAAECGMSERTLDRYLNECIASGWVIGRKVYRDGRQRAHEWFVVDATDETECRRLRTEIAKTGQILCAGVAGIPRRRLHSVLRSKNNGADDDAAQRGGGGSDEQDSPNQAAPAPALAGARTDAAEPEPKPVSDEWASVDEERRDRQTAELAYGPHPASRVTCPHCGARPNQQCGRRGPNGWQALTLRRYHESREDLAKIPA